MEQYHVTVTQGMDAVHFAFNSFSEAKDFIVTCMESADKGSCISYCHEERGDDKG